MKQADPCLDPSAPEAVSLEPDTVPLFGTTDYPGARFLRFYHCGAKRRKSQKRGKVRGKISCAALKQCVGPHSAEFLR